MNTDQNQHPLGSHDPDPEAHLQRMVEVTALTDQLRTVPEQARKMRFLLPAFVGAAFGLRALWDGDWVFLLKAGLIIGVAMGFIELVAWGFSRRIKLLEGDMVGSPDQEKSLREEGLQEKGLQEKGRHTMRSFLLVLMGTALAMATAAPGAAGQAVESQERPVSGISFGGQPGMRNGIPHPASLALAYFDSLHLTPEQVQEIREIQDRVEEAMMEELLTQLQDGPRLPGLMWSEEPPDPDQLRAQFQQQAETEAAMFLRLLEGKDEVFRVLSQDQKEALLRIHRDRYSRTAQLNPEAPPSRPCTRGGAGGGGRISDRVAMVYSVDFHGDSAQVGAVFVGKADGKLHSSPSPGPRPQLPDRPRFLSGGSMGIWHLGYDDDSHTAWVQDRRISLEYGNVILLEGVERLQEPPRVAGIAKVPSMIYTGGCPPGRTWSDILREELQKVPEIREFMESG